MSLAKLKEKYDPLKVKVEDEPQIITENGAAHEGSPPPAAPKVEETTNLQSWKDSAPVIRLSEYLKKHKDQGIKLYQADGSLVLRLEPEMTRDEFAGGRGEILKNVWTLLIDARDDLKYLIVHNLIDIPVRPGLK